MIYIIIKKIYYKFLIFYWFIFVRLYLKLNKVNYGKKCKFYGFPIIQLGKKSKIIIGNRVVLCSDSRFTQLGISHPVILKTSDGGVIDIEDDVGISGATIYADQFIKIGKECLIGADVKIFDTNFHSLKIENRRYNKNKKDISSKGITIEKNCFIGTNAIILKGSMLSKNTVVPAGTVIRNEK